MFKTLISLNLYIEHNLQKKKSEVAARSILTFNPAMNIEALSEIVADTTENIFNDDFFHNLNGVCNALDNVEARRRFLFYFFLDLSYLF